MKPSALLLDLDGTLVDSEPLQQEGYRRFFAARGWDEPDLTLFTGRRAEDVLPTVDGPWRDHDHAAIGREVTALVPTDVAPAAIPGAAELIRAAAAAGVRIAVVTSAGPAWVQQALGDGLGILDLVDLVVTAEDVVDGKPYPACYLLACERLGLEPATTLAAEDSTAGVQAAVAAGVGHVVGVTTSRPASELREAGAHAAYPDLVEVAEDVRRLAD
ncbi:HAD family hydrolase [Nocardioides currus]|uniref:Haloacid dehalogenase n=1 Tax=Nocardioides currus TaxID=2133958 RepID=A0A2R7YU87_9ACTN|nr:HAD family phosphatase [Nocardioides currus]PUA79884.1 haloacid dehalogenase [Nocardioides currus]